MERTILKYYRYTMLSLNNLFYKIVTQYEINCDKHVSTDRNRTH